MIYIPVYTNFSYTSNLKKPILKVILNSLKHKNKNISINIT